jgi:GT2 family glycosyltransferase
MNPDISVIVPTGGREARLAFLLDALGAQTLPRERFEVVVVRGDRQEPPYTRAPDGLAVRFLSAAASRGPTDKRNVGWRASEGPLIAFTDDDCRPRPDWLEQLMAAADGGGFLQGRTEPDPDESHLLRGMSRSRSVVGPSPWYPGCNMAYPRELLERLDGFDESFTFGSEDTDLALRALALGADCQYVDGAVVYHAVFSRNVVTAARDTLQWPSFPRLFAKHPAHRQHLYLHLFRNKTHATLTLGLVGLLAFRQRKGLAAVAFLPYIADELAGNLGPGRRNPRAAARLAAHLPARALVDLLDVVATTVGGASQGVPMV